MHAVALDAPVHDRRAAATLAASAVAGCALLALVDPDEGGPYPACPTRALLGIDCPACGTLRGVHALTRGRALEALDHNVLLVVAAPLALLTWWRWVRTAAGHPARPLRWPAWVVPVAVTIAIAFTLLRNLPLSPLGWLDSA